MKRFLMAALILILLTGALPAAFAEPLCAINEVDLSGVRETDGRLMGEIRVPDGLLDGRLLIDCPIPEAFTREQCQTLTVAYQSISKKELAAALRAIGQTAAQDSIRVYNSDSQTNAEYAPLSCGDPGYYFGGQLMNAAASADPMYDAQYAQAKAMVQALIAQLGGTVYESLLHAARLDADHIITRSPTADSDGDACKAKAAESISLRQAKCGLPPDTLTMVNGLYDLYGLPVMSRITWAEGRDTMGAEAAFFGAVGDDGALQYGKVENLPVITAEQPAAIPARSWQALLSACVANGWCVSANGTDNTYENYKGQTITLYATYAVITELHPCWIGIGPHTLVPGYYLNLEERVAKDDTLKNIWESCGNAATLTGIT